MGSGGRHVGIRRTLEHTQVLIGWVRAEQGEVWCGEGQRFRGEVIEQICAQSPDPPPNMRLAGILEKARNA